MSSSKRLYEEALDKIPARPSRGPKAITPCTDAICELFDATVIPDVLETSKSTEDNPCFRRVYYIGYRAELNAGLVGSMLTICFDSIDDVEDFCERNWEKFHLLAASMEEAPVNAFDIITTWR
jgi:hypothetical protein